MNYIFIKLVYFWRVLHVFWKVDQFRENSLVMSQNKKEYKVIPVIFKNKRNEAFEELDILLFLIKSNEGIIGALIHLPRVLPSLPEEPSF